MGKEKKGFFKRLRSGLSKSREQLNEKLETAFIGRKEIDEETLDDLEEILITSDIGFETTQELIESVRRKIKRRDINDIDQLKAAIRNEMKEILAPCEGRLPFDDLPIAPYVVFFVGVNGVGKTTTIGKLAMRLKNDGKKVVLAAADTFRAAAAPQLVLWGERAGAEVITHQEGSDPSAVVYDAIQSAQHRLADFALIDTAGRLHTKKNLMEEMKKMCRVADKVMPGAPHEKILVLDATNGQNAVSQTKLFHEAIGLTGLVMTKLDSTSKGGILLQLAREFKLPIYLIGIGEKPEDLQEFSAEDFAEAML
ncbi:MAG: signal recognition particle-docking protein FtsY [Deltaproteobacteria bacterium]|nr:MAG: signal recognition particle-docking protein FtsY [Deltaproteobacteria bacterium]